MSIYMGSAAMDALKYSNYIYMSGLYGSMAAHIERVFGR